MSLHCLCMAGNWFICLYMIYSTLKSLNADLEKFQTTIFFCHNCLCLALPWCNQRIKHEGAIYFWSFSVFRILSCWFCLKICIRHYFHALIPGNETIVYAKMKRQILRPAMMSQKQKCFNSISGFESMSLYIFLSVLRKMTSCFMRFKSMIRKVSVRFSLLYK